jgi:hypothetical protein
MGQYRAGYTGKERWLSSVNDVPESGNQEWRSMSRGLDTPAAKIVCLWPTVVKMVDARCAVDHGLLNVSGNMQNMRTTLGEEWEIRRRL